MLADPQSAALLLRKIHRVIEVVGHSPSEHSHKAAFILNQQLHEGERLFGRWATVINALLQHAVAGAPTPEAGQRIVDDFAVACVDCCRQSKSYTGLPLYRGSTQRR